jgi:hypothetical protein
VELVAKVQATVCHAESVSAKLIYYLGTLSARQTMSGIFDYKLNFHYLFSNIDKGCVFLFISTISLIRVPKSLLGNLLF